MATLQNIRNRAGFLVAVIGIAMLAFILGGLFSSGNALFHKAKDRAFEVNGTVIPTKEYFDRVKDWENFQKMINGENSLNEKASSQIRELVFQQIVRERILDNQTKKLGLIVTKDEMNDLVKGENVSPLLQQLPFFVNPQTGIYDSKALMNFLSVINKPTESLKPEERAMVEQYKSMWMFIENMIKYQRLEEKYRALLSNAVMVPDAEAKTLFDLSQKNADMKYAVQNYFSIPDSLVKVTNEEINAYYNKHKDNFILSEPIAKITYFTRQISPSDEDFADVEKRADEAFKKLANATNPGTIVADYSDVPYRDVFVSAATLTPSELSFASTAKISEMYGPVREGDSYQIFKLMDKTVAPDSVHLRMIVVPESSAMGKDTVVTHFVDSVYNEIENGKSFADVANTLNPQSRGGDAGWLREIDLASAGKELMHTAFSAPVGSINKISVPGQRIIMQVEERTKPVGKYKIAIINMPVVVSEKTSNNVDNELNKFVSAPDVSQKFKELATKKGYSVIPDYTVAANDFMLGEISGSRQVINWAMNAKKMGSVKKFDLSNLRIVARVDKVITSKTAPLSEVSTGIKAMLLRDKKAEKMIADLKAKKISGLEDYAEVMKAKTDTVKFVNFTTQNISGIGYEPVLNAISAYAPLNQVVGPVKGSMGVFVVVANNRTQGSNTYDAAVTKKAIQSRSAYRLQMQSMEVLKEKLKVKDNRYRFF